MTNLTRFSSLAVAVLSLSVLASGLCACGQEAPGASAHEPATAAHVAENKAPEPAPVAEKAPEPTAATPAAAVAPSDAPEPTAVLGKTAPDFTLTDIDGKATTLSGLKGKTVVLEWFNPDCPFVKHAHREGQLKSMAAKVSSDSIVWLSINSSAPGKEGYGLKRNLAAKTDFAMQNTILLDENGAVGHAYGALKTPTMFIIDKHGALVYRGGIDNAPIGKVDPERPRLPGSAETDLINYVNTALQDLAEARMLRLPETPAYGCSVKYQS